MHDKKMFKVLNAITRKDKTFWNRVGIGFLNKDNSINVYLDAMPKNFEFQIREYDEADFKPRPRFGERTDAPAPEHGFVAPSASAPEHQDAPPF